MTSDEAQEAPEGESLFDFLYLDRARLASYAAQLFADGSLTQIKRVASKGDNQSKNLTGGVPGIAKGTMISGETLSDTIERHFDATWAAPLELFKELNERGYVRAFGADASIGQLVLFAGRIQILDLRMLQKMWKPVMQLLSMDQPSNTKQQQSVKRDQEKMQGKIAELAESLPHIIQLRGFNKDHQVWSTLQPDALTANVSDLVFKYGPSIDGEWRILGVLDAKPFDESQEIEFPVGLGDLELGVMQFAIQLKQLMGRHAIDYGITPLAIYRRVPPA